MLVMLLALLLHTAIAWPSFLFLNFQSKSVCPTLVFPQLVVGADIAEVRNQALLAGATAALNAQRSGDSAQDAARQAGKTASALYKSLGGSREDAPHVAGEAAAAAIFKSCLKTDCKAEAEQARQIQIAAKHSGD